MWVAMQEAIAHLEESNWDIATCEAAAASVGRHSSACRGA
jgi:hypothetical protein